MRSPRRETEWVVSALPVPSPGDDDDKFDNHDTTKDKWTLDDPAFSPAYRDATPINGLRAHPYPQPVSQGNPGVEWHGATEGQLYDSQRKFATL